MFSGEDSEDETEEHKLQQESIEDYKDQAIDSPIQRKPPTFEAQDLLLDVNLGTLEEPRMTKVSEYYPKLRWTN